MYTKNSFCSYCGAPYGATAPWPRICSCCKNKSYINPIPVVVLLLPLGDGVVVIRRGIEPQKGTLTLPGGYIDYGETWQIAAKREMFEETGIHVPINDISLYDVQNGLDNTLVVFGLAVKQPEAVLKPFTCKETTEVVLIKKPIELGFRMHTQILHSYFSANGNL